MPKKSALDLSGLFHSCRTEKNLTVAEISHPTPQHTSIRWEIFCSCRELVRSHPVPYLWGLVNKFVLVSRSNIHSATVNVRPVGCVNNSLYISILLPVPGRETKSHKSFQQAHRTIVKWLEDAHRSSCEAPKKEASHVPNITIDGKYNGDICFPGLNHLTSSPLSAGDPGNCSSSVGHLSQRREEPTFPSSLGPKKPIKSQVVVQVLFKTVLEALRLQGEPVWV